MPNGASSAHRLEPKIAAVLREGYGLEDLKRDLAAALTVAIVALPLSMAIAVASGVGPERGLYAAIAGGFIVSLLSGSRHQIGGPAGAFIVLVSATVARFGLDGLLLTVGLSGLFLALAGFVRLGGLTRHMPHAVVVGFTAGIALTIMASQVKDFAGLHLSRPEPGPVVPKLVALADAASSVNPGSLGVGAFVVVAIFALRRWRPTWPALLISVCAATVAARLLHIPAPTVGDRFGALPHGLPAPRLPPLSVARIREVLPSALSFTLLGAVESLLSAKVADGMTGRVHRSNMELVAQGAANVVSALFGGLCVTGTVARTATNVRAGARSPLSGILHSGFLLVFMAVAAPLADMIPLAALAGVLVVVSWNMFERAEFARLLRSAPEASVLLATFGLTALRDLTTGIVAGCCLAAVFAIARRRVAPEGD